MAAAGHRTNEYFLIGEVFGEANAIAEQRAVREWRAGIDRYYADSFAARARVADQSRRKRRLADTRRPGKPDGRRAPGLWVKRAYELAASPRFGARNRPRERARIARLELA